LQFGFFLIIGLVPGLILMSDTVARLNVSQHKDISVVEFTESKILDEMNITEIGQGLAALVDSRERPKLLLDFANVDHLSSAALGMLINVNNRVKQRSGQLRLAAIRPQIMEVFVITKLNRLFRIAGTRDEAIGSFE
jgi:anti-sigma B factor antagonist